MSKNTVYNITGLGTHQEHPRAHLSDTELSYDLFGIEDSFIKEKETAHILKVIGLWY